jgi:hypothetical protein
MNRERFAVFADAAAETMWRAGFVGLLVFSVFRAPITWTTWALVLVIAWLLYRLSETKFQRDRYREQWNSALHMAKTWEEAANDWHGRATWARRLVDELAAGVDVDGGGWTHKGVNAHNRFVASLLRAVGKPLDVSDKAMNDDEEVFSQRFEALAFTRYWTTSTAPPKPRVEVIATPVDTKQLPGGQA